MVDRNKGTKHRDATGHTSAEYEHRVITASRAQRDENSAFLHGFRSEDAVAEGLAQAFLESATSGEESEPERHDEVVPEEAGGPFVRTRASQEFAYGLDESNIAEATREPLPKTSSTDP